MKKLIFLIIVTLLYSAPCIAGRFTLVTVNFPPYYGENLHNQGWVSEVVKTALEIKGYDVEIKFMAWKDAVEATREGDYDALLGAYRTRERAANYYFTAPVGQVRTGFFKRRDAEISFSELKELKKYKIGVVEGYATSKKFDSADFLKKIPVVNLDTGLKQVYKGVLDLMADSRAVGKYHIKNLENQNPGISTKIEFIRPFLAMNKIYVAISKKATNAQKKLIHFNQGLMKIYRNGTFRRIKNEHKKLNE